MASDRGSLPADSSDKLKADPELLWREARNMEEAARAQEEAAQARVQALLSDHMRLPATINSIEVHGAKNTRRGFLDPLFKPLVEDSRNADTTLGDVLSRLDEVTQKLNRFDIFQQEPTVYLSDARQSDPLAAGQDLDISIRVAEKSRFIFKAGTEVGNVEGGAYTNALLRNIFGGAETLSINASTGTRTRSAYSAAFATPINSNPDLRLSVEGLASSTQKPWASHEEGLKGGSVRLGWQAANGDAHSLAYTGSWRQLTGLAADASTTVRADAGDSVKSSLSHSFTRDRRDNPMLPQSGYLLRYVSELAGWGPLKGDVSFAKTEVEVAGAVPVSLPGMQGPSGVSIGGGLRAGTLYPLPFGYALGGPCAPSRINDRFQLGGPTDVRGFNMGGLGPHDGRDSVGGDVFAAGSVNMLVPFPRAGPESPLRLQFFANGGRLVALSKTGKAGETNDGTTTTLDSQAAWRGMKSAVRELGNGLLSLAAGAGIVYAHPAARFELNFSLPLVMRRGEDGRKGLQVGIGINFL